MPEKPRPRFQTWSWWSPPCLGLNLWLWPPAIELRIGQRSFGVGWL